MTEITHYGTNDIVFPHLIAWEWQVALYIFLGGLVAGLMVVACVLLLLGGRRAHPRMCRVVSFTALPALGFGLFLLWLDLGDRFSFYRLYLSFQPTSVISWGSWIILATVFLLAIKAGSELVAWEDAPRAVRLLQARLRWAKPLARQVAESEPWLPALAIVVELGVGIYTGLLLSSLAARPLWSSPFLAPLFLVSALASGSALMAWIVGGPTRRHLLAALVALVAVQLLLAVAYVSSLRAAPGAQAVDLLLRGSFAPGFWAGFVVLGNIVAGTAALWAVRRRHVSQLLPPAVAACVLIGSLALRLAMVYAGQLSHL